MTPQQKAIEIYHSFDKLIYFDDRVHCKDCALLCVEEIITENHLLDNYQAEFTEHLINRLEFWEEVKIELEKI